MNPVIPAALTRGYETFRAERFEKEALRYRSLAEGQTPKVMIIGCADSRVDPATIFSAKPGELFVVRNVAALVPPYEEHGTYHGTSAALEFAVTALKVESVVVLGHGLCGGISAALSAAENKPVGQFIGPWVAQLSNLSEALVEQAVDIDASQHQRALEHLSIKYSLENLESFPFVRDAVAQKKLTLHGAWFSIAEGELHWLDKSSGNFEHVQSPDLQAVSR